MTRLVTAQTVFIPNSNAPIGWKNRWVQSNKVGFMNLTLNGLFTVQMNWQTYQKLKLRSAKYKKNNSLKIILKSNFSWRCFLSLLLFSYCQFYCIFFFVLFIPNQLEKKTAKHANHMTLRLGGFLMRRTYVGSEAMPTFKLPHYRWEKHILCNLNMLHALH